MSKIAVFIDGGYIDKVCREEFGAAKISYDRFSREICNCVDSAGQLFRTYYYNCLPYRSPNPTPEEARRFANSQNFLDAINRLPRFEVRLGRLARRERNAAGEYEYEQKMVDVLFSIDLVLLAAKNQVSDIALVAGDSDFVPAIRIAKQEGVSIWLFHGERLHDELWTIADERVRINRELLERVRWADRDRR